MANTAQKTLFMRTAYTVTTTVTATSVLRTELMNQWFPKLKEGQFATVTKKLAFMCTFGWRAAGIPSITIQGRKTERVTTTVKLLKVTHL